MVMVLSGGMCHPDPQYSVASVREAKYTRLGYGTRLSRLHTLDPSPISIGFSMEQPIHQHQTPSKKITKGPQISSMYLKQTRLRQDCTTRTKGEIRKKELTT
jgi:hypothetical protein